MRIRVGRGKHVEGEIGVNPDGSLELAPASSADEIPLEQLAQHYAELMLEAGADPKTATGRDVVQFILTHIKAPDWAREVAESPPRK